MLHKLFGWGETKIQKCLSISCNKEDKEELANIFKVLCPLLYSTIMNKGVLPPGETPQETPSDKKVTPSEG
jgi:hypothetical protein